MSRLRVFLSSTALDLAEHRRIADDTLLRLQQQSVAMERFGPLPGAPVEECERLAASCDLVVCIVAHRYGYEPEKGRGSITRREVEAAKRAGKPVYAWIVDDRHPWTEPKEQDRLTQPDVQADPDKALEVFAAVKALQDFKTWLRKEFTTDTFTTAENLGLMMATALASVVAAAAAASSRQLAPAAPACELRIVHALQPAPNFTGRDQLLQLLSAWVDDIASPDRVQALVAAGGTGKTAIAEQVVSQLQRRWPPPGTGNVLVWSFYEKPDADAFVRECAQLFLGEADDAPIGGRLERLQRGLRDGRPHLIVLDGLERVQAEAGTGRVRGELEDHTLKLLLQAIAAGLGRTRALVTSRFPLTDLRDWRHRGVVETALEDLSPGAAREVLRGWGVQGTDEELDEVSEPVGRHALSVSVIGSYLSHFEGGRIEAAAVLRLDSAAGDDPKAAKLARVLAFYAERLPVEERDLLARLSVFPRGITLEVLGTLVDAGGDVAGALIRAETSLRLLLARLLDRGLIFRYTSTDGSLTWTAHPFVRERFAGLLGCRPEEVFNAVATHLGQGLENRPESKPEGTEMLDRYEQLIEATRLGGRVQEAFDLYWYGLGNASHLIRKLGDFARAHRILTGILRSSGNSTAFEGELATWDRVAGLNNLGIVTRRLGRLREAADIIKGARDDARTRDHQGSRGLQSTCGVILDMGLLPEALAAAEEALAGAIREKHDTAVRKNSLCLLATAHHRLGYIQAARDEFAAATALESEPMLYGSRGQMHARHHLELGEITACRAIADAGLDTAQHNAWNMEIPGWHALLARIALVAGNNPCSHIDEIRAWTACTGDMDWILEAHDLAARFALASGDLQSARAEADDGLRQARVCGYRLRQIDLLVTLSAIYRAWPDADQARLASREALDLATAPECRYAWGEADAAHAWGLAFEALGEREHAQRAFGQALAVRERIEHPQLKATRVALARLA